jgi:hypothetical protein
MPVLGAKVIVTTPLIAKETIGQFEKEIEYIAVQVNGPVTAATIDTE